MQLQQRYLGDDWFFWTKTGQTKIIYKQGKIYSAVFHGLPKIVQMRG